MSSPLNEDEVVFEFNRIGSSVKVSAVDPASGVGVSIVGPATAHRDALRIKALRKLAYVLAKQVVPESSRSE